MIKQPANPRGYAPLPFRRQMALPDGTLVSKTIIIPGIILMPFLRFVLRSFRGERPATGLRLRMPRKRETGCFVSGLSRMRSGVDCTTARVPFSMPNSRHSRAGITTCPLLVNQTDRDLHL